MRKREGLARTGVAANLLDGKDPSVDRPETRYAWDGDIALAYRSSGVFPFTAVRA